MLKVASIHPLVRNAILLSKIELEIDSTLSSYKNITPPISTELLINCHSWNYIFENVT